MKSLNRKKKKRKEIIELMHMGLSKTLGDSEGQGSLTCCNPWGRRIGHNLVTEQGTTAKD